VKSTATRLIQSGNQDALSDLFRRSGLIEASRSVPSISFGSQDEAYLLRDQLAERFDSELDSASEAGDDETFAAMTGLRNAVVQHISARAPDLARVVKVTTQLAEPALVAAYRLYGDATKSDEIVWRNSTPHPGFLPGGSEIDFLTVSAANG
jgi:prophage DNA circulation protein